MSASHPNTTFQETLSMGLLSNLFGSDKDSGGDVPARDTWDLLCRETIAQGGRTLRQRYWSSIYLGAYAPQFDMAVFKGTAINVNDAESMVTELHDLLGDDNIGLSGWDEDTDPFDVEDLSFGKTWENEVIGVQVDLLIDNHHPSDDPVMLSIRPWARFKAHILAPERTGGTTSSDRAQTP